MPTLPTLTSLALATAIASAATPVHLGSQRELFVDDHLIDTLHHARQELHHPAPQEIVLHTDLPWEGIYSAYFTVFQDGHKLRMYYRGMPEAKHDLNTEVTCYAESTDGIHWTKPQLGLFEVHGTTSNNVVLAHHRACHNFTPFLDANPNTPPAQKYKAVGGTGEPGLIALYSPDAIHWSEIQPAPVITEGAFDSQNVAFWSHTEQQYVCYFRVFRNGIRWIARTTSRDFIHWTAPVDLTTGDQPAQHLYTNQILPYHRAPHIYLGLPTRFMPGRQALSREQTSALGTSTAFDFRNDCADILLTATRGNSTFTRHMEAFIRPGLDPKNWTSRANYAAYGIIQTSPEELSLYVNHNLGYPSAHVRRYTLRTDGFTSISAPYSGGTLLTKPITFSGSKLEINYSTSAAGSIQVEIQHPDGTPAPNFTLEDCPEIIGDEIQRTVIWKSNPSLEQLANQPVRLLFHLSDANLFSLQFL